MKRSAFFLGVFVLAAALAGAQDGAAIIAASRSSMDAQTVSTRSRLVITARNGSTTERVIDQYSKKGPQGDRMIIQFQSPASVRGTRFLTMENGTGGTDQWIFLPSLGRTRRIAADDSGGNFMGTDMSYDDMAAASRDSGADTHRIVREEVYQGVPCYVIESIPKDGSYQYSKTLSWIAKENNSSLRIEMFDRRGAVAKVMESSGFREVSGRLTATVVRISTVSAGTSTTVYTDIIRYDEPIPEGVFTLTYLETGVPG
ncbi:MAG: outer membrane lipoprotein-sorting protein [Spirochaetales bacterium]|jgi:outer membrane lipoprotein-sorting protein|nr:outer membrane lipoprotein-sorting protein [Spirochaetales bacterium]